MRTAPIQEFKRICAQLGGAFLGFLLVLTLPPFAIRLRIFAILYAVAVGLAACSWPALVG